MWGLRFPYELVTQPNPIFALDLGRLRWLRTSRSIKWYSLVVLLGLALMAVIVLQSTSAKTIFGMPASLIPVSNVSSRGFLLLLVMNAGLSTLANFYYVLTAFRAISTLLVLGQWEELRLTHIGSARLVTAKDAIVQIKAWRIMIVEVAFRLSCVLYVGGLGLVYGVFPTPEMQHYPQGFIALAVLCVIEPMWRMPLTVGICLAIPAALRRQAVAATGALGVPLLVWLSEAGIISGASILTTTLISLHNPDYYWDSSASFYIPLAWLLIGILSTLTIYSVFQVIRYLALRRLIAILDQPARR